MKKNRMMRLASTLLVAVLITTSTISGTYAKYVTTDGASDTARVAKFGVEVKAEGTLFESTYASKDNSIDADTDKLSVVSLNGDKLVAPGTENVNSIVFSVTGAPEVDVEVELEWKTGIEAYDKDVYLKAGKYPNMTTGDADAFELEDDYYPIVYTLEHTGHPTVTGNLATIKNYLNDLFNVNNAYINANTDLGAIFGTFELSWAWAFDDAQTLNGASFTADEVDQADTLLGDLAADKLHGSTIVAQAKNDATNAGVTGVVAPVEVDHYNLYTGIGFDITVTQVD